MTPPLIPAPTDSLQSEDSLSTYLIPVVSHIRDFTGATEVAVYLVDPATRRIGLRAWAAPNSAGAQTGPDAPHDLTDHGIDGADLSVETLRNFVRAAPPGQRLARPLNDGASWVGALIGVAGPAFTADSSALFATAGEQLGAILERADIRATHLQVVEPESSIDLPAEPIFGHGASDGTAYAPALLFDSVSSRGQTGRKIEESRSTAIQRLETAIDETRRQLEELTADSDSELYDVVSLLFSTHVMMLTDEAFSGAMLSLVAAGQTPEDAVQSIVVSFVRTFRSLREARLAEKAQDVRDIGYRLMQNLADHSGEAQDFTGRVVLVEDVLPSDLIRLALGHAAGVVILGSAVTAHISILAQSLGLPALMTPDRTALEIVNDTMILLDADDGKLYVTPSPEQVAAYGYDPDAGAQIGARSPVADAAGQSERHTMADGWPVSIYVNVNLLNDARRGNSIGAEGIGLYRSEFPFIIRNDFISEEDQYRVYRAVVQSMPGKPVVLRTADIGGDKLMAGRAEERNPFLGVRGIRFSLANRDLFRHQLRAMLRAGVGADLRIMFPMVAGPDEIEDAREEVDRCIDALRHDGVEHNGTPKLGAMVELPAAVIGIEELAARTDFLSIGTNDLIMYLLAVDRTNERLSELYRSHHPVVLKTLADIARRIGSDIDDLSVCGESAADPLMIPFFLGIGIRKLSVAPRHIRSVAATTALYDQPAADEFARQMLSIRTLRE
ncbi:MAG: phosphoenolpyruvate--protein phosphotransferase, partial [Spirochaetia bacterium]